MSNGQILVEELNSISRRGFLDKYKIIPDFVLKNLNQKFEMRKYQTESLARFIYFLSYENSEKSLPVHLLFNMATGSGKTFLMASNILYLYKLGYRNFIFFVNNTTIIRKTKANFLDKSSPKYLFAEKVVFNDKEVHIQEVDNFEGVNQDNINILFTTIQGLHSRIWNPQENAITLEDFKSKRVVFLSDEAHHINVLTRKMNKLKPAEQEEKRCWEKTVEDIFKTNKENILLEYTATVEKHQNIFEKYKDKIIYEYTLKEFREDKFSKDVQIMQSDLDLMERALQAVILSQYRRKVAEKYKIQLKPVILIKSQKTIVQSEDAEQKFKEMIKRLKVVDAKKIEKSNSNGIIKKAFTFFKDNGITYGNLVREIKTDFSEEKCIAVNSKADSEEKQIKVNTLEAEHNETRVIFTVNMLNEGWDVLNLYDIVRLYETRDTRHSKAGGTTISEAQLIGRGARYYPFIVEENQDRFKRKYDEDINSELRVLEELHYHSLNDSRYITEIKAELVKRGIAPPDERRKQITVSIKESIKKTKFWTDGLLFINEQKKNSREKVKRMRDLVSETIFKHKLRIGKTTETGVFDEVTANGGQDQDIAQHNLKFNRIEKHINRKALDKVGFYWFSNLKQFFPSLKSVDEFLTSDDYLGEVDIEIYGLKERLDNLSNHDKYEIALEVFKELANKIESSTTEYIGTKEFKGCSLRKVIEPSRTGEVLIGGDDKEFGIAMSETTRDDLRLRLKDYDWYMYDENYGTSEEKHFVQFIRYAMDELKKKYTDIYLLRNEHIFKIYRFSDGKAVEPDFVLFLKEKDTRKDLSFQLFVESKGQHLLKTDQWKEAFLKEIEGNFKIVDLLETDRYRLVGLPFYNETLKKQEFKDAFDKMLKLHFVEKANKSEKSDLFFSNIIPDENMLKKDKYSFHLPVYSLQAVATAFSEEQKPELMGWKKIDTRKKIDKHMFVAKVVGKSMEPTISDGSYCIFRFDQGGSRNGLVVLVESRQVTDPETNQKFTIKRYRSEKGRLEDGGWRHKRIILSPDNNGFKDIILKNVSEDDFRVVAEFICVI